MEIVYTSKIKACDINLCFKLLQMEKSMTALNRRSFLSYIPTTAIVATASPKNLLINNTRAITHDSFCGIALKHIHPDTHRIHTLGYSALGDRGHATYVSDRRATKELAAIAPLFSKASADGRYWRAATNSDGLVPASAGGAVGLLSVRQSGAGNQQPAIAQALLYQQAIGAKGLSFTDGNFSVWCPHRGPGDDNIAINKSGIPCLINGPTILKSGPNLTRFNRRKFDGSDPAIFSGTQYLPYNSARNGQGIYWRGGMFLLVGKPEPRPKFAELTTLHLIGNWDINGGILQSPNHPGLMMPGTPPYYALNTDGSGWDVTDKPIWAEDNRHTGDVIFEGNIRIGGFRGELFYGIGGKTHGSVYQTGVLTLHNSDGNGFNPGPYYSNTTEGYGTVQIESIIIKNVFQSLEGCTGWNSKIANLEIEDCFRCGGLMAGNWAEDPQRADRPDPELNIGTLKATSSGIYTVSNANKINSMNCIDTNVWIGQPNWDTYNVEIQNLTVIADKDSVGAGAVFWGGPDRAHASRNNLIHTMTLGQSASARAKGYCVYNPVNWYGDLGGANVIHNLKGVAWAPPRSENPASVTGGPPQIIYNNLTYNMRPGTSIPKVGGY